MTKCNWLRAVVAPKVRFRLSVTAALLGAAERSVNHLPDIAEETLIELGRRPQCSP